MHTNSQDDMNVRASSEEAVDPRVDLAVQRTEFALERTQLAWIRTMLAAIGTGVALDKGLELVMAHRLAEGKTLLDTTHALALCLTASAVLLMVVTAIIHRRRARQLSRIKGSEFRFDSILLCSAMVVILGASTFWFLLTT